MSEGRFSVNSLAYEASQVKLLRAASEIVGGDEALAARLDIRESLLAKFVTGQYQLPAPLLLQTMDLILDERETRSPGRQAAQHSGHKSNA